MEAEIYEPLDEIPEIFSVIEEFSNQSKTPILKNTTAIDQFIGGLLLICVGISFVVLVVKPSWFIYIGVLSLITAFIYGISQITSFGLLYSNPLDGYAALASTRTKNRIVFVSELAKFSKESLIEVSLTLNKDLDLIDKRIGLLIGVIDKTGLIPAAIAVAFAIKQQGEGLSSILYGIAIALYATAMLGKRAIEAIRSKVEFVDLALKKQNNK